MPYAQLASKSSPSEYNGERLLNYVAHWSDTLQRFVLLGRGGLTDLHAIGAVQAMEATSEAIYAVAGGSLYKITDDGADNLGVVGEGEAYIAASFNQVAVVVGGKYFVSDGGAPAEYATGSVDTPAGVTYRSGFFIVWGEAQGRSDGIQPSNLDDATTFDAIDVVFAESDGDPVVCMISALDGIWAFGARTIENLYNSGNATAPIRPSSSSGIFRGCLNGRTVASDEMGFFWLGNDGHVYHSLGTQPQKISTPEVEASLTNVNGGFLYSERGHRFYVLTQEDAPAWAFDIETGVWAERSTGIGEQPWAATDAVIWHGTHYIGTGTGVATQSEDVFTDNGTRIHAEVISSPIEAGGEEIVISRVHVDILTGRADVTPEAQVMMQVSRDMKAWGNEQWRGLGLLGDYGRRIVFRNLGQSDVFQLRLRVTDEAPRDIRGVAYG